MLGVPLHGKDVAPRFCSADRFLIAQLDGNRPCHLRRVTIAEEDWARRLEQLSAAGVRVLLCGGFNRRYLPLAEGLAIRVIVGLVGEAEQLIDAFLCDEIERHRFLPCRRGRGQRRAWQGEHQRGPSRHQKE